MRDHFIISGVSIFFPFPKAKADFLRRSFERINAFALDLGNENNRTLFSQNLDAFHSKLIAEGVEKDDLTVIQLIVAGRHPFPGQARNVSPDWNSRGGGWKIHLHIKPWNQHRVWEWLTTNCQHGWKYFEGGEAGEKEFTIYVGGWDEMETFASIIQRAFGGIIELGEGLTLGDIRVLGNIFARFDIDEWNLRQRDRPYIIKSGFLGCPRIFDDLHFWASAEVKAIYPEISTGHVKKSSLRLIKPIFLKSVLRTNQYFGTYFTGSRQQYLERLKGIFQ